MRSGRLKKRVILQSATETQDAHGQPVKTWSNEAEVWAGVEPVRGSEAIVARQMAATALVRIVIRYRSTVTTDWRVVYGNTTYEIESIIDHNSAHVFLELMCRSTT